VVVLSCSGGLRRARAPGRNQEKKIIDIGVTVAIAVAIGVLLIRRQYVEYVVDAYLTIAIEIADAIGWTLDVKFIPATIIPGAIDVVGVSLIFAEETAQNH
jgi:ABC-type thiamin/hydroxymethylpyrimidine transport system permease subunit